MQHTVHGVGAVYVFEVILEPSVEIESFLRCNTKSTGALQHVMKGKGGNAGEMIILLHCIAWLATALQCVMKVKRKDAGQEMIPSHCIMQLWICATHDESEGERFRLMALSLVALQHTVWRCYSTS